LIGFDKDPAALERAAKKLAVRSSSFAVREGVDKEPARADEPPDWPLVTLIHGSFAELANGERRTAYDGILADLGVSSLQLTDPARDLVFRRKDRWTCG